MMDACIGAVIFYIVGYCVAYGDESSPDANGFIGVEAILVELGDYNSWFFQWVRYINTPYINTLYLKHKI